MQENKISNFFDFFIEYCIILSCKKQQFLIFLYFYITITKIKKQQNSKTVRKPFYCIVVLWAALHNSATPRLSFLKHKGIEEAFCPLCFRAIEEVLRCIFFGNFSVIQKNHPVCHCFGKLHFVGNNNHRKSFFASSNITSRTSLTISGSRAAVTSSKSITSGCMMRARTMATLCFCPPDNCLG